MCNKINMQYFFIVTAALLFVADPTQAHLDHFRAADLNIWAIADNASFSLGSPSACSYCGDELIYQEPPPDDIIFIPPPPMHPSFQNDIDAYKHPNPDKHDTGDQCYFCELLHADGSLVGHGDSSYSNMNNRIIVLLASFLTISSVLFIYVFGARRTKIIASLTRAKVFKSNQQPNAHHHHSMDKNGSLHESLSNSGVRIVDPCYIQTNRDKNLTSPIINDQSQHKKTSIPSKYWAQPGSIIGRTIRRIPNEYEVPSSQTNSTGTSSAVYADMNPENNQRFLSPYNLHTYAEVREVLDPHEHFHTSSNSSAMLSESNYDNAIYNGHNGVYPINGGMPATAQNGSVQMSDFNSMRPMQSMAYGQSAQINQHPTQVKHQYGHSLYEQPPQRAQVIITSNNQGVNPTLLNYKEKIHNVI